MKTWNWLKWMGWMSLLPAIAIAGGNPSRPAFEPAIPDGYYEGKTNTGDSVGVFTRHLTTATGEIDPMGYGLIIREADNGLRGALFRIEESGNGVQAWIPLVQTQKHGIATDSIMDPAYSAQIDSTKSGKIRISLNATQEGLKLGCASEIKAKSHGGKEWLDYRTLNGDYLRKDAALVLKNGDLTGTFKLDQLQHTGPYEMSQYVNGVGILREQKLDMEAADGRSNNPEILAVVVLVRDGHVFKDYNLTFIRLEPGISTCNSRTIEFERD